MWNMILGPEMWNIFSESVGDLDIKYLPLLFTRLSELNADDFTEIMQEVLGKTRIGRDMMKEFVGNVVDEIDYEDFEDSLGMKNLQKNMISDEYLTPEELDLI